MAKHPSKAAFITLAIGAVIIAIFSYLLVRTGLFLAADYIWYEKIVALALLLTEGFALVHAVGYFLNVYHVLHPGRSSRISLDNIPESTSYPPVTVVVSAFKEPLEVLEDTLTCFYNLTYPNKRVYLLDDTRYDLPGDDPIKMAAYRKDIEAMCEGIGVNLFRRRWRGAKAGMINDFLHYMEGAPCEGIEFHPFQQYQGKETAKYLIVFDADMNALPDFVEPLVAFMETHPELAFIQTPQYYTNFEDNRVARGAGLQQAIFYEYICEGKSIQDAMFCCGTNVIFRCEALTDVGGFDESSVTEDFATSLKFHAKGWSSAYLNKICAFGMGPEDLGGYFKQQFRWALGTVGLFRFIVAFFLRNPRGLPFMKWWEYFLSGSHYFVGWVLFIMMLCPILYLFLGVPSYFIRPDIYLLFFLPYILLTVSLFLYSMRQRNYRFRELGLGIVLQAVCFPVYMRASLLGLLGVKGSFATTPKGGATALPLLRLWPQMLMGMACAGAIAWGAARIYYEREAMLPLLVNSLWCTYNFCILCAVLYFNHPQEKQE